MKRQLLRRLKTPDIALITVGAIIGSGIFRTPAVVAQRAHVSSLILACWVVGGVIALIGAFIFAELAARRPVGGGLYGYLRDAYHPIVGFLFGWAVLLITGTGGNAAAAVLFAGYLEPLTGVSLDRRLIAVVTLLVLAGINILGVRQGGNWQNFMVILKIGAIAALVVACLIGHPATASYPIVEPFGTSTALIAAFGVAMLPVLFTYHGFSAPSFVTAETVQPERTIPRGLIWGIGVVIVIYVLANAGYLRVLGAAGLAGTKSPAADAFSVVVGPAGGRFIALAIALSTLGYLSTCMLAMPRIYHQMAADGVFFKSVAWISPSTHVPAVAIGLQAVIASLIALSGSYEQIINWVVGPQWFFIFLAAGAIFIFRRRDVTLPRPVSMVPGHPFTTGLFMLALLWILGSEFVIFTRDTFFGFIVVLSGIVVYYLRQRFSENKPLPAS